MTRKEYRIIASVLRIAYKNSYVVDEKDEVFVRLLCEDMAKELANDNDAFKRDVFLNACGVDTGVRS